MRTVVHHKTDQGAILIQEFRPRCRLVTIDGREYYLPFPYTQFITTRCQHWKRNSWRNLWFFSLSPEPIKSLDSIIWIPPFPNCMEFNVCMGVEFNDLWAVTFGGTKNSPIENVQKEFVNGFWNSEFVTDGVYNLYLLNGFGETLHKQFQTWESIPLKEITQYFEISDIDDYKTSFEELLRQCCGDFVLADISSVRIL